MRKESRAARGIGEISYPSDRKGILIYIKSSLTGDENDYVFHYKKRYSAFPHETTLDQLFSEEQFEAYRALGFHATHGFFDRRDQFAHRDPKENACVEDLLDFLDDLFPLTPNRIPAGRARTRALPTGWRRMRRRPLKMTRQSKRLLLQVLSWRRLRRKSQPPPK